jgi:hypothetical protein
MPDFIFERHDDHHAGIPVEHTILIELRELRTDFNVTARATAERLAKLEERVGSISDLKEAVEELKAWKWRMVGIGIGASSVVSVVAALVLHK